MRVSRKLILAGAVVAVAGSSAVAVAATQSGSSATSTDPVRVADRDRDRDRGHPFHHHRGGPGPLLGADAREVFDAMRKAVLERVVTAAGPIIDQAVKDGDLTKAQADTARQALADVKAGKRPSADAFALLREEKVREVAQKVVRAVAGDVPGIVTPIIDQAVKDGKLTKAQGDELKERVREMADQAAKGRLGPFGGGPHKGFGPSGPGFGHGGPGHRGGPDRGLRPGGPGDPGFDRQGMSVLRDVWEAVRKQAPAVGGPIVDKAVKDGRITKQQGDELRSVLEEAAKDGRPHLHEHRDLVRDADVRRVARDISEALAERAPSVGGPIIDQAVKDGKLTKEQGERAKERLEQLAKRAGG